MPGGQASSDWMDVYTNFFEEPGKQPIEDIQNFLFTIWNFK